MRTGSTKRPVASGQPEGGVVACKMMQYLSMLTNHENVVGTECQRDEAYGSEPRCFPLPDARTHG